MCIVAEESDESEYWLTIIRDTDLSNDKKEQQRLLTEAEEILKIMSKAKNSTYTNIHKY
jgi:four helix bundle protein